MTKISLKKMRWAEIGEVTRIHNPITSEHTIMRQRVLPALIRLLAANKHHDLPQHVYELGTVVQGHENRTHLAFLVKLLEDLLHREDVFKP